MVVGNVNATEMCDAVVIGGGPGGYVAAIRLAQLGKDVILIDKRPVLGGVCLNEGCIPSKAIIHAAETFEQMNHASTMGLNIEGTVKLDMAKLQEWKNGIVKRLTGGVAGLEKGHGVRVLQGTASFRGPKQLELINAEDRVQMIDFDHAIVATGSVPLELPFLPVDGDFVIGSKGALDLSEVPETMVVIGGGYIGLELGMAYAKLGSKVTVVELQDQLLGGGLEPEIHRVLLRRAKQLGMEILLGHKAQGAKAGSPGTLTVQDKDGKTKDISTHRVLVSIGRRPYSDGLGLENAGLAVNEQGFLPVNEERRTGVPHIFAIGDITEQPMLAHKAYLEAKVAAEVIAGHPSAFDVRAMPAVMFTDPEIATVGMSEAEAKAAGYQVKVGVFPWKASGRALSLGATEGLSKIVYETETERILGVHIAGAHAAELIAEGTLALELDAFLDDLAHTIHPHPTLSETVLEAAEIAMGTCAHFKSPNR